MNATEESLFRALYSVQYRQGSGTVRHASVGDPYHYWNNGKDGRAEHSVRRIDALVIRRSSLWAVEIKVSVSDLRRELATPEKTETWAQYVNAFYFLVPEALEAVAVAEIPVKYGVLIGYGGHGWYGHTKTARRARQNRTPLPLPVDTWRRMAGALGDRQVAEIDRKQVLT